MRVCMIAYTFYESDNRVRRYAETLVKRGDKVDAIVLCRHGQSTHACIEGVNVYRIQKRIRDEKGPFSYLRKLLMFLWRSMWAVTVRHIKARYDVIHVHSVPDFEVFAAVIPRLMGAKVILDIHDIVPELYASKFRISQDSTMFRFLVFLEGLSMRHSDHVIVANHLWHDRLIQRSVQPERCSTILNYPDLSIFRRQESRSTDEGTFVMFYPGTLSWHQGVDLVISAVAQLRDKVKNLRLIILGDGAERDRLVSMAAEHGLEDRVTVRGPAPIAEVARLMATIDLGIEPKRKQSFANEALSTKILEFMAVGAPVLASDTCVHQLYFGNKVQFFESDNVDDLAAQILVLMRNPARRHELRECGRIYVLENNWDVKKHEYLDLVDRLSRKPTGVLN